MSRLLLDVPYGNRRLVDFRIISYLLVYVVLRGQLVFSQAEQVVLLDTAAEATLEWTRYPFGPDATTPGWVEESFTNFEKGINWRSYVVCDVAYENVNNWLWTPFVERSQANRIYIEIKFTIRDCSLFPGNALSCKETFSLLYYEFDAATREPPPWEPESYKLIGRIAAGEGRFNTNSEVIINTEIKSIPVTKKGVYFAFRDQGACISLLAIKVYYITCPAVTINFAHFPATPTGKEVTVIEQAIGRCVDNAEQIFTPGSDPTTNGTPMYLCKGDGKWYLPTGGCKCKPGFEPDFDKQTCNVCPPGKYKFGTGDDRCVSCPQNSKAPDYGFAECRCNPAFYRAYKDPKSMPCTQPPSAPQNLTVNFVDQSTVILSWNAPYYTGGRNDTTYRITCDVCGPSVLYIPTNSDKFNETKITISGLNPVTSYRFVVYAENGVSNLTAGSNHGHGHSRGGGEPEYVDITVTTEATASAASVNNVRVTAVKSGEIALAWDPPFGPDPDSMEGDEGNSMEGFSNFIETYEIKCFVRGEDASNASSKLTTAQHAIFGGLRPRTEYGCQIRAKTTRGWGEYSPTIFKTTLNAPDTYLGSSSSTSTDTSAEDSVEVRIIAGATVALVVLLVGVIVMTVIFLRSRSGEEFPKKFHSHSECHSLDYRSIDSMGAAVGKNVSSSCFVGYNTRGALTLDPCDKKLPPGDDTLEYRNGEATTPLFATAGTGIGGGGSSTSRTYIDPHTYEDPNQAVKEFAREIDSAFITIEAIIGGGEFGDVCRGKLKSTADGARLDVDVAIKTLKPGSSDKARNDFLTEASIMGQFDHPNVIFLQGVVTKSKPVMIITEYMENGSLDTFVRANDSRFQMVQLVGMLRGIACGMQYLSEMNYVHRDLAARNVLVNSLLVCKIADFGLSREIECANEGAYTTRGGKIPVRWTAPEAIAFRKFTSASDVWSFGIVVWEVLSYGERPYWNWSNQDVIKSIERGYRLPAPMDCPEAIYQLMLDCWQKERMHRPSFATIVKNLDKLIRCPDALRRIVQNNSRNMDEMGNRPEHGGDDENTTDGEDEDCNSTEGPEDSPTSPCAMSDWLAAMNMSRYRENFARAGMASLEAALSVQTTKELQAIGVHSNDHQKVILNGIRVARAKLQQQQRSNNLSESFLV